MFARKNSKSLCDVVEAPEVKVALVARCVWSAVAVHYIVDIKTEGFHAMVEPEASIPLERLRRLRSAREDTLPALDFGACPGEL